MRNFRQRTNEAADSTQRMASEGGRLRSLFAGLRSVIAPVAGYLTFRAAADGVKNLLGVGAAAENARRALQNL